MHRFNRSIGILGVTLGLLLSACATAQTTPVPATTIPIPATIASTDMPTPESTKVASLIDYVASDPALVGTTGRPQFVEFFAFWCTTCQSMRPTIHNLQDDYGSVVDFVYLDIDAAYTKALQQKLTFTGLRPTMIFFNAEGVEQGRLVGPHTREEIEQKLEALVAAG